MGEQLQGHRKLALDEMETVWGGSYIRARGSLGVEAFGLGVMQLPPQIDQIPHHVHTFDGQEEVYIALNGSGWVEIADERVPIDQETAVRVGPTAHRRLISGETPLQVLVVGGTPGQAYEAFELLELGAPEPNPAELPGIVAAQEHESSDDFTAVAFEDSGVFRGHKDGVSFFPLGRALGVTAFGIAAIDLEFRDGASEYPLHDHSDDGQTEVYVVQRGSGTLMVDGEPIEVGASEMAAVAPEPKRQWIAGPDGVRFISIGAPTGKPHAPRGS